MSKKTKVTPTEVDQRTQKIIDDMASELITKKVLEQLEKDFFQVVRNGARRSETASFETRLMDLAPALFRSIRYLQEENAELLDQTCEHHDCCEVRSERNAEV